MSEENVTETATNLTESFKEAEQAEEEHEFDAISALALNVTIIGCLLLAYFVKKFRIYYLPERYVRTNERTKTASFGSFTTVCDVM
jgi:hypothetical protein